LNSKHFHRGWTRKPHEHKPNSEIGKVTIEEIFETLSTQDLRAIRDLAEQTRVSKLESAKAALLEEMQGKVSELGLSLNDLFPSRRTRRSKSSVPVKYRSPDGQTWSGRGHAPLWLRQLELQGHNREEYKVSEG
jgi:DNA-binding protein H-NS